MKGWGCTNALRNRHDHDALSMDRFALEYVRLRFSSWSTKSLKCSTRKEFVFLSCFYASRFGTRTHFVAFLAGCKQGQICCPQYSPPSKTKCWSDRAGDWDRGSSSLLQMDIVVQPHSRCAYWLQRPPLWYPTDAGRETRSSYAHLPLGHWFPSCTLCSS